MRSTRVLTCNSSEFRMIHFSNSSAYARAAWEDFAAVRDRISFPFLHPDNFWTDKCNCFLPLVSASIYLTQVVHVRLWGSCYSEHGEPNRRISRGIFLDNDHHLHTLLLRSLINVISVCYPHALVPTSYKCRSILYHLQAFEPNPTLVFIPCSFDPLGSKRCGVLPPRNLTDLSLCLTYIL